MKENKDCQIKFRLTAEQKDKITEYCKKHDIKISEFIRSACEKIMDQEKH
jgi:uncharacterized protein (DUF1778 family)